MCCCRDVLNAPRFGGFCGCGDGLEDLLGLWWCSLAGAVRRGSRPRRGAARLLWLVARDAAGTAQVTSVREPLRLALDLACLKSPLSLDDNAAQVPGCYLISQGASRVTRPSTESCKGRGVMNYAYIVRCDEWRKRVREHFMLFFLVSAAVEDDCSLVRGTQLSGTRPSALDLIQDGLDSLGGLSET